MYRSYQVNKVLLKVRFHQKHTNGDHQFKIRPNKVSEIRHENNLIFNYTKIENLSYFK